MTVLISLSQRTSDDDDEVDEEEVSVVAAVVPPVPPSVPATVPLSVLLLEATQQLCLYCLFGCQGHDVHVQNIAFVATVLSTHHVSWRSPCSQSNRHSQPLRTQCACCEEWLLHQSTAGLASQT